MQVEWLEKALKNLEDEANYIDLENPKAADDFSDAIFASVDKLAQFSSIGCEGRVKHIRGRYEEDIRVRPRYFARRNRWSASKVDPCNGRYEDVRSAVYTPASPGFQRKRRQAPDRFSSIRSRLFTGCRQDAWDRVFRYNFASLSEFHQQSVNS